MLHACLEAGRYKAVLVLSYAGLAGSRLCSAAWQLPVGSAAGKPLVVFDGYPGIRPPCLHGPTASDAAMKLSDGLCTG